MSRRRFRLYAALVVLLALALRLFYAVDVKTTSDIRGDINDYVLYAWNLGHAGVFSSTLPVDAQPLPDSYRGPGYPIFLMTIMSSIGSSSLEMHSISDERMELVAQPRTWIDVVYVVQAVMGSLTVLLGILLARFWISRGLALGSGLLIALWPHLITFSSTLLSETLFAFVLLGALTAMCFAEQRRSLGFALGAAAAFGFAYCVNPVIGAFPVVVAILLWIHGQPRSAILFLAVFALAPSLWMARNQLVDVGQRTSLVRAKQNFVEGSWPQYHAAVNARFNEPIAGEIIKAISDEEQTLIIDSKKGLSEIASRIAEDPLYYANWYLIQKPILLWEWRIRIGANDINFLQTKHDPFESVQSLRWIKTACWVLNPILLGLAIVGSLILFFGKWFRAPASFAGLMAASFLVYVTFVHDVLQAEPRYAIPYRPVQIVVAFFTAGVLASFFLHRRPLRSRYDD